MGYSIRELTASVPVEEYVRSCVDVEKFLGFCRACSNYGRIWACPPFDFDPMDIWNRYRTLTLYAWILTPDREMTMEELMEAFRTEKQKLSRMVLDLEKTVPGSRSMAASTCIACSPCARAEGKPCRHPEQVRHSIEALGGDVALTMEKYLHTPIRWAENGQLPEYLTLAAGLLTK